MAEKLEATSLLRSPSEYLKTFVTYLLCLYGNNHVYVTFIHSLCPVYCIYIFHVSKKQKKISFLLTVHLCYVISKTFKFTVKYLELEIQLKKIITADLSTSIKTEKQTSQSLSSVLEREREQEQLPSKPAALNHQTNKTLDNAHERIDTLRCLYIAFK